MAEPLPKRSRLDLAGIQRSSSPTLAAVAGSGEDVSIASPGRRRRRPLSPRAEEPAGPAEPAKSDAVTASSSAAAASKPEAPVTPAAPQAAPAAPQAAAAAPQAAAAAAGAPADAQVQLSPSPAAAAAAPAAAVKPSQASPQQAQQQEQQQGGAQGPQPPAWQQRQQQQMQQKRKQQQKTQQQGLGKKKRKNHREYLATFFQCVKRELPYEALHVYQKMKQAGSVYVNGKLDLGVCNGLLNVAVGNWQWELHQRHQHLLRQAQAQGQDTAPLQAAFQAYLAAERERAQQLQQQQQQQAAQQQEDGQGPVEVAAEPDIPAGTPPSMVCHIQRAATDMSVRPEDLHSRRGVPDPAVFDDMPAQQAPFLQLMSDVMTLLVSDLEASGITPDEQLLMGLARVAGIMGDPDKAFDYAQQVVARGSGSVIPRLRDFHPALVGYALTGQADKAGEVIDCMVEHCKPGDLTEAEFALWLEAIAAGGTYEQLCRVLRMVGYELNHLKPRTLALVQRFFESDRAAAALTPGGAAAQEAASRWQTQWVVNNPAGHVAKAGASLALVDLTDADWQLFDEQLFKLGSKGESSPGAFKAFQAWLDRNGPFDLILDGANIAFFGENYAEGGFKPWKIKVAYDHLQALYPEAKILVILHQSRVWQTQRDHKQVAAWLKQLDEAKLLYSTPRNMNDDMFWMYATIHFRSAARLVSHDQMRDHVWSMLRPKHMLKWRQRHVIDFHFSFNKDVFYPQEPRPYTPCVQEVRPGVWLLPSTEGAAAAGQDRWLMCQAQPV